MALQLKKERLSAIFIHCIHMEHIYVRTYLFTSKIRNKKHKGVYILAHPVMKKNLQMRENILLVFYLANELRLEGDKVLTNAASNIYRELRRQVLPYSTINSTSVCWFK